MNKPTDKKAAIRNDVKKAIANLSPEERTIADGKIRNVLLSRKELGSAKNICIYVSRSDEADTREIITELLKRNKTVIVPRVAKDNVTLHEIHSFDDLCAGTFHILEPKNCCPRVDPSAVDLFIVPGVAFDRKGHRLGRGLGYFDKLLKNVDVPIIGLAYAVQVIAQVPATSYDVPVTALVTEDE